MTLIKNDRQDIEKSHSPKVNDIEFRQVLFFHMSLLLMHSEKGNDSFA